MARQDLIASLARCLEREPFVLACWLEGADALGRVDEYSDIDLWLDVTDGFEQRAIERVRQTLLEHGRLEVDLAAHHPHPLIRQQFLRLHGLPEFLFIDLCVQSHSRGYDFIDGMQDLEYEVLFDKASVLEGVALDRQGFERQLRDRVAELEETYEFFHVWVKKALRRGSFLEAQLYYRRYVLAPLVELMRIRFVPTKFDYHLKDVERDLPAPSVCELTALYRANSLEEIADGLERSLILFRETLGGVKEVGR